MLYGQSGSGLFGVLAMVAGCAAGTAASPANPAAPGGLVAPPESGDRVEFNFRTLRGESVSSSGFRGRTSVLLFGTSYSLPTQVLARKLGELHRTHVPRINAALLMLEPASHAVFAETFADALKLAFPVVISDPASFHVQSVFGEFRSLPAVIVFDANGRVVWREEAPFELQELEQQVARADGRR